MKRKVPRGPLSSGGRAWAHIASVFYPQQAGHGISESDINPTSPHTSVAYSARARNRSRQISLQPCIPPLRAAMDASRKRKANNATPSNTDGSATKKIKLVVRDPPLYALFRRLHRVCASRAGAPRMGVCV